MAGFVKLYIFKINKILKKIKKIKTKYKKNQFRLI